MRVSAVVTEEGFQLGGGSCREPVNQCLKCPQWFP